MPGLILHEQAQLTCPHGGTVMITGGQTRVTMNRQAAAVSSGKITVAGCPFQVPVPGGTKPQPCVTVQWTNIGTRVKAGAFVLLQPTPGGSGAGVCQSAEQIPQGPPMVAMVQTRVKGS